MARQLEPVSKGRRALTPSSGAGGLGHLRRLLRLARTRRGLSQQALAAKLGIRQRQISDLERSTIDPRLSTLENVARALDMELMLVPRPLISSVEALLRTGTREVERPLYALDGEDDDGGAGR